MNADVELRSGRTGTVQCSPYQLKLSGNDTVGTDDCNHEHHAGANQDSFIRDNQPDKNQEEVLLLELQE